MSFPVVVPTVSSGFWGNAAPPNTYQRTSTERKISQALASRGNAPMRRVMRALNGVAPGAAVVDTRVRITAPTTAQGSFAMALGGVRAIETVTGPYNGVTTTAQRDYINTQIYDSVSGVQTYPVDLSGNGGGGKVQR